MGAFAKGSVVIVRFPFTDLSSTTLRPAIVVQNLPGEDMILCMVTSQMARDADAIPLNSHDFARGTIHKPSNVRPNRLFTGANSLVDFQAGSLTQAKMDALTNAIVVVLQR